jgi:methylated-DNA-[protein]-cysteine S-methyltransferase/AraC family transcriptional regulator of adaptative response/methylated-DNA-[protein]-cysteine methyltransferase
VCAILIGTSACELKSDLARTFPKAWLDEDASALRDDVANVVSFIESPKNDLDLTLDMRGTPFQHRVWDALRAIPAGVTVTYTQLANRIGQPRSVRAVASACASNVIAFAIPCHRALRKSGALAGYRWGIERKEALIEKEAAR